MCSVVPNNDPPSVQSTGEKCFVSLKYNFDKICNKHYNRNVTIIVNVLLTLLLTVLIMKLFTSDCMSDGGDDRDVSKGVKAHCNPYTPLNRIVVDVDLNDTSHCYSSISCVTLAESLHRVQGKFRYNFIIGAYGFVYIEQGYKCQSEEWGDALYIRLPVDSIYGGQDFMATQRATSKFNEILREGLECGKIHPNYTLVATGCGKFNEWCSYSLQNIVNGNLPDRGFNEYQTEYYDETREDSLFNPFNLKRVYSYKYKLIVCKQNSG